MIYCKIYFNITMDTMDIIADIMDDIIADII